MLLPIETMKGQQASLEDWQQRLVTKRIRDLAVLSEQLARLRFVDVAHNLIQNAQADNEVANRMLGGRRYKSIEKIAVGVGVEGEEGNSLTLKNRETS